MIIHFCLASSVLKYKFFSFKSFFTSFSDKTNSDPGGVHSQLGMMRSKSSCDLPTSMRFKKSPRRDQLDVSLMRNSSTEHSLRSLISSVLSSELKLLALSFSFRQPEGVTETKCSLG